VSTIYEPDFGGHIGRTHRDSTPWWPPLPEGLGKSNVVMIVLDDLGFAHFGAYGSTLTSPNVDRLAANGLRYTSFHTTALCSPTRAALLTGRNHHSVGMRGVSNWNTGYPHMRGGIAKRAATVAEVLREHGYATFATGKWHLAPMEETSAAGPHHNWPLQKGFDKFYGFLQGETDQFFPELTRDNTHIDPPGRPEDGYHVSEDIVDQSIAYINDLVSVRPDRPFFLYVAFGAMHAPHQAPQSYLDKWRGKFDEGYEVIRQRWFERQLELGIVPPDTTLAPLNPGVPRWTDLTDNQRAFSCRLQEAFAAMLEHTDDQIGRLVAYLEDRDLIDDTVILVMSDNGASREGGPFGVMDEFSFFNGMWEDIDAIVADRLDDIGGPHSHSNYPWGWAQAGNSPLRWYKQNTYGGGVRDPLIVHWPKGIGSDIAGGIRRQFCHAVDITPTLLEIVGATAPTSWNGVDQLPMHGSSIVPTFADADAPAQRKVQYFEQMGHRGIWVDGWKATTYHEAGQPFENDTWGCSTSTRTSASATTSPPNTPTSCRRWSSSGGSRPATRACCRSTTARSSCSAAHPAPAPCTRAARTRTCRRCRTSRPIRRRRSVRVRGPSPPTSPSSPASKASSTPRLAAAPDEGAALAVRPGRHHHGPRARQPLRAGGRAAHRVLPVPLPT
jgi:arylsulfatase A-like enzyme